MTTPDRPATDVGLRYEVEAPNAYAWTETAYDLLEAGALTASVIAQHGIRTARASGTCPRCEHDVRFEQVLDVITGEDFGTLGPEATVHVADVYVPVIVSCRCTERHEGRPEGVNHGCGINFRIEVIPGVE